MLIRPLHVSKVELTKDDQFILLACDGLFDVMDNQVHVAHVIFL